VPEHWTEVAKMAYVGILLVTILISFIVVRIGGFALQMTGIEPDVARFQALSAFSGTGFTTTEAERVVRHKTRRRIVTILIILGNAGLVTIIATLVASFTQVTGYGWFFIRLAIIVVGIIVFYQLIIRSRFGNRVVNWLRKPVTNYIIRVSPEIEEILPIGKEWSVSVVKIEKESKNIGLSMTELIAKTGVEVLAIERAGASPTKPHTKEKVVDGDRLFVYGTRKAVRGLLK
jgi:MFS family permease